MQEQHMYLYKQSTNRKVTYVIKPTKRLFLFQEEQIINKSKKKTKSNKGGRGFY